MPTDPEKPTRARGKALPRSGVDLDRMSEVTDADIARARVFHEARAPGPLKGLIDATPEPNDKGGQP